MCVTVTVRSSAQPHTHPRAPFAVYMTPEQQKLFGSHPSQIPLPTDMSIFCHPSDPMPDPPTPPGSPSSRAAAPYGDLLHKISRAFNKRDGPAFVEHVNNVSRLIRELKESGLCGSNPLIDNVRRWPGMHPKVAKVIIEQTYQRSVGPRIKEVRQYQAWTSNIYGELMPKYAPFCFCHASLGLTCGKASSRTSCISRA